MEKFKCCLCEKEFYGYGNNPYPLSQDGRCCDECNNGVVEARIKGIKLHELKLQPKYYNFIKEGTKKIELRLFDEKRRNIELGDIIKFKKEPELKEEITRKVIGLIRADSFENLFKVCISKDLADISVTKNELMDDLEQFYTKEKQEKYGVIGIILGE